MHRAINVSPPSLFIILIPIIFCHTKKSICKSCPPFFTFRFLASRIAPYNNQWYLQTANKHRLPIICRVERKVLILQNGEFLRFLCWFFRLNQSMFHSFVERTWFKKLQKAQAKMLDEDKKPVKSLPINADLCGMGIFRIHHRILNQL